MTAASNDYEISAAQPEDLAQLPAIERKAASLFPQERLSDPDQTLDPKTIARAAERDSLWVARVAGSPVGYALCEPEGEPEGPWLHLLELSVDPAHGRRGIGRALVETVLRKAQERGFHAVSLTTFADLRWNGPFYAGLGFRVIAGELGQTGLPTGPEAAPAFLEHHLQEEQRAGMTLRVAMCCPLPPHG